MANRNFPSAGRIYSPHVMPVEIDCKITIGASGAVAGIKGAFVRAVTRLGTGLYQIQLMDNYNRVFAAHFAAIAGPAGAPIAASAMTVGVPYQIASLGTTDFTQTGTPAGVAPAVGLGFVATAAGTGTGTVVAVNATTGADVSLVGDPNLSVAPQIPNTPAPGAILLIQTTQPTSSSVTTFLRQDPVQGVVIIAQMLLSNSSVIQPNE